MKIKSSQIKRRSCTEQSRLRSRPELKLSRSRSPWDTTAIRAADVFWFGYERYWVPFLSKLRHPRTQTKVKSPFSVSFFSTNKKATTKHKLFKVGSFLRILAFCDQFGTEKSVSVFRLHTSCARNNFMSALEAADETMRLLVGFRVQHAHQEQVTHEVTKLVWVSNIGFSESCLSDTCAGETGPDECTDRNDAWPTKSTTLQEWHWTGQIHGRSSGRCRSRNPKLCGLVTDILGYRCKRPQKVKFVFTKILPPQLCTLRYFPHFVGKPEKSFSHIFPFHECSRTVCTHQTLHNTSFWCCFFACCRWNQLRFDTCRKHKTQIGQRASLKSVVLKKRCQALLARVFSCFQVPALVQKVPNEVRFVSSKRSTELELDTNHCRENTRIWRDISDFIYAWQWDDKRWLAGNVCGLQTNVVKAQRRTDQFFL